MNKIKVWGIFLALFVLNYFLITVHYLLFLLTVFIGLIFVSYFINSYRESIKRIQAFAILGILIFIFQLIFNHTELIIEKIFLSLRVVFQLAAISESVFIVMKLVSPLEIVKSLNFLPKTLQILLSMTFYFIPMLMKEYETIRAIQSVRGLGLTLFSRVFFPIFVVIPLLHRVFQRTETITYTVLSRGYEN